MNIIHTNSARVSHISLNRPDKRNAIDDELFANLLAASAQVKDDDELSAIVLTGEGQSFCAGLDFSIHTMFADEAESGERPYADPDNLDSGGKRIPGRGQRIVNAFRDAPAPVIAALHGHAIGGGLQLALGADIRLVAPDTLLGLKEIDFGMTVDMGATQLLPRLVGIDRALDLIISGRLITGEEAFRIGLATRLSDDPRAEAVALAHQFASRSRTAVHANKRMIRMSETGTISDGMREELRVMAANIGSPEQVSATRTYFDTKAVKS